MSKLVDLSDLTWEQKEQVLRELFARMNGAKTEKEEGAEKSQQKQNNSNKMLALDSASANRENLTKYETDDEEDVPMGKQLTVSAKALAKAM